MCIILCFLGSTCLPRHGSCSLAYKSLIHHQLPEQTLACLLAWLMTAAWNEVFVASHSAFQTPLPSLVTKSFCAGLGQ